ncbi:uncharacterized protein RCH25_004616 [Pelodytes ibericus]
MLPAGDGDESSYLTDTTLNEEYTFSDTSLDLSLSEHEESDGIFSFSTTGSLSSQSEDASEYKDMRRRVTDPVLREIKAKSRNDSSWIFQKALHVIKNKQTTTLRNMCQSHFFLPSSTDKEEKSLLHHAASSGNEDICQVLLDTNVGMMNVDRQDIFGKTALHYAVQSGNYDIMKLLLKNGAKSEIPDKDSKTALDVAIQKIQDI